MNGKASFTFHPGKWLRKDSGSQEHSLLLELLTPDNVWLAGFRIRLSRWLSPSESTAPRDPAAMARPETRPPSLNLQLELQ